MSVMVIALCGVALAVLIAVVALRLRKRGRDRARSMGRAQTVRLPPMPRSPYQPARGLRILGRGEAPLEPPRVVRPRIDPSHRHLFSDEVESEGAAPYTGRHNNSWLLERSAKRSGFPWLLLAVLVVIAALVGGAVWYF